MRIWVSPSGPYRGLRRRFDLEGDELVSSREAAELVIEDPLEPIPGFLKLSPELEPTHVVCRWFHEGQFLDQTFVGIPLVGLMDQGLGPKVGVGIAGRYVQPGAFGEHFNDHLRTMLEGLSHSGPVALTFSNHDLVSLQTGMPFWGVYALLEGVRGSKVSSWWLKPGRIYESWCGALLISRTPYPVEQKGERASIFGVEESNVWILSASPNRDGFITDETELAVVTARGNKDRAKLNDVHFKILQLARQIKVEGVQYRTDMAEWVRERWARLKEWAIV